MTPLWTLDEVKDVLEVDSPLKGDIHGVSINSKDVNPGDLFIPLRGETYDAHQFVGEALSKGAIAALVDHLPPNLEMTSQLLQVPDTYQALLTLATHARYRTTAKIIGITGSMGKTTTKELLELMLRPQGRTSASVKSFNNHWGVPVSLCRLPQKATYGIFEVGMNHGGEIAQLVATLKPSVALITEVAPVHIGNFPNFESLIQAKAEIFQGMKPDGIAILNRDSLAYEPLKKAAEGEGIGTILTFGRHPQATLRLTSVHANSLQQVVSFVTRGRDYSFSMKTTGEHWAMNALGALTVVHGVGADLQKACEVVKDFELLGGRGKRYELPHPSGGTFILIDESYNSNPTALKKSLETLKTLTPVNGGRRVAVLGDMYELGPDTGSIHAGFQDDIAQNHIDQVYTSGREIATLYQALPSEKRGFHAETVTPVAERVLKDVHPGDIILVKGSRGGGQLPRMQEVVDTLIEGVR